MLVFLLKTAVIVVVAGLQWEKGRGFGFGLSDVGFWEREGF